MKKKKSPQKWISLTTKWEQICDESQDLQAVSSIIGRPAQFSPHMKYIVGGIFATVAAIYEHAYSIDNITTVMYRKKSIELIDDKSITSKLVKDLKKEFKGKIPKEILSLCSENGRIIPNDKSLSLRTANKLLGYLESDQFFEVCGELYSKRK